MLNLYFFFRYKEVDRARSIYQRFLHVHGTNVTNWMKYAKFEEKHGFIGNARAVRVFIKYHAIHFFCDLGRGILM
jgi:hypothetical protein